MPDPVKFFDLDVEPGPQPISDTIVRMLTSARIAQSLRGGEGCAWVEGEVDGEWVELRITIKKRPEPQQLFS